PEIREGPTSLGPAWAFSPTTVTGTAVLEYDPTEILPQVGALSKHAERLCRPGRQASRAHPRGKPGFWTFESGCGRETDSLLEGDGFELSVPDRETVKPSWETGLLSRKRERICWGTEGSNPSPSSAESAANFVFGGEAWKGPGRRQGTDRASHCCRVTEPHAGAWAAGVRSPEMKVDAGADFARAAD